MKDRNKRRLIIYGLLGVLMLTTVAYAALQTVLNVSGTVVKKGNLWNIYFTNPSSASTVGSATGSKINIQASTLNFQVSLYKPGDKVTYTVDIKNGGTIDATLNSISLTGVDTAKNNNINYTVTYSDGSIIKQGDILNIGTSKTIKIIVEFDSTATSIAASDINLSFGVTLIYNQTSGSSSSSNSGITSNNVIAGIYGNSIQNGTPTPTSPVEIQSVGERTKNLIDEETIKRHSGYYFDGTGAASDANSKFIRLDPVTVKPNTTYKLSSNLSIYSVWFFNSNNSISIDANIHRTDNVIASFTTPANCNMLRISLNNTSGNADTSAFKWIQLEEGSTATSYEPYGYKIPITVSNGTNSSTTNIYLKEPLRKVGDTADYLDLVNKKVVRNVKEIVLNGSETINLWTYSNQKYGFYYYLRNQQDSIDSVETQIPFSNYFKKGNYAPTGRNNSIGISGPLYFGTIDWETVVDFKSWLTEKYNSGLPVVVDYVLSEQTEENIEVPSIPELSKGQKCEDFYKVSGTTVECSY